ncbi:MAG: (d)CMP kinase [Gemmatimonadota bacterium]|nr:MAG: (d)CMP kinase [Gemmatimonadota bacterium]
MIIAIDGPAGSGKTTTAKEVARRLGFLHLDSGALYRAFALAACRKGWADAEGAVDAQWIAGLACVDVGVEVVDGGVTALLEGSRVDDDIRTREVTACASKVSAFSQIRDRVNAVLRRLAAEYPGGVVCEGRDMGTVVFPEAELKVYMVAEPGERARRRLLQRGEAVTAERLTAESARLVARDTYDSQREASPLRKADSAMIVDTTRLSFEEQVTQIVQAAQRLDRA